ncbi:MAG: hypothetical protein WAZ18_01115 [Alphaproteobacteria bacterium]
MSFMRHDFGGGEPLYGRNRIIADILQTAEGIRNLVAREVEPEDVSDQDWKILQDALASVGWACADDLGVVSDIALAIRRQTLREHFRAVVKILRAYGVRGR